MKKIFSLFSSAAILAFAFQGCQPKVDTAREWASIDSMANVRVMMYRDSLRMSCMNNVMAMAQQKADSMMMASMKNPGKGPKPKPKPTTQTNTPTVENRPGATNQTKGTVVDRPGTVTPPGQKGTVTNRPGATKKDTVKTPPKL